MSHSRGSSGWIRCAIGLCVALSSGAVSAGSFELGPIDTDYRMTFAYALAARTKDPAQGLINGPIDPFQSSVRPNTTQVIGFTHTGLPNTMNFDDGDRNFKKWSVINNRITAYGELNPKWENYGAVVSGSAFYDLVYHQKNDNDSLPGKTDGATVNKEGVPNEFTSETRHYDGQRARLLEAYIYGNWTFGEASALDLRVGQQLVAWGESLFFSGVALAQGPADAAKAFVPGAEVKDILLPVNQVAMRLSLGDKITLLGQYKLAFHPTELFPNGDFYSPADLIGPGSTFGYGSVNPAYASQCVGLLKFPGLPDLSNLCTVGGGLGGPLLGANPYILVTRDPDDNPNKYGQYGIGITSQITPTFNLGLYHLRYGDTNPAVNLTFGFPVVLTQPVTVTTEVIEQPTPVSYNLKYFGGIHLTALSYSTVAGPFNIAGEFIYRQNQDVQVKARISGVLSPVYTRGNVAQALMSSIYVTNPGFLVDDVAVVTEAGIVHVTSADPLPSNYGDVATSGVGVGTPSNGFAPGVVRIGNGGELFADRTASGIQTLAILGNHNILSGWDMKNQIGFAMIINGNPPLAGAFGSLIGEGDKRFNISSTMTYLSNLEFTLGYNFFFGDPDKRQHDESPVEQNPYADRDNITFTVKYNL